RMRKLIAALTASLAVLVVAAPSPAPPVTKAMGPIEVPQVHQIQEYVDAFLDDVEITPSDDYPDYYAWVIPGEPVIYVNLIAVVQAPHLWRPAMRHEIVHLLQGHADAYGPLEEEVADCGALFLGGQPLDCDPDVIDEWEQ